jgi:hypothetical protein
MAWDTHGLWVCLRLAIRHGLIHVEVLYDAGPDGCAFQKHVKSKGQKVQFCVALVLPEYTGYRKQKISTHGIRGGYLHHNVPKSKI